jgi:hypothetical protein
MYLHNNVVLGLLSLAIFGCRTQKILAGKSMEILTSTERRCWRIRLAKNKLLPLDPNACSPSQTLALL